MAFFRSRTVNLLNLHYGIHAIALSGGASFFAVYLLKAGVSLPGVLVSIALILAGRFVVRPIIVPIAVKTGMRALVIAGTVLTALQYPLLAEVHGLGPALVALCVVAALGDTLYWSSYHAYFAALGNHEHRGSEVARARRSRPWSASQARSSPAGRSLSSGHWSRSGRRASYFCLPRCRSCSRRMFRSRPMRPARSARRSRA
jgi:hypothetical protein